LIGTILSWIAEKELSEFFYKKNPALLAGRTGVQMQGNLDSLYTP
jgi:hypothetical protein